jgi:AcrR family transcriptional regulator
MASPAPAKSPSLQPLDWILAALARLSSEGVDAVRIEVLARDLGVSKGSFYWHFQDREDLLMKMLSQWESEETQMLETLTSARHSAPARWARFIERIARPGHARLMLAIHSWARRDAGVAARIATLEKKRARFIADVLRDIGLSSGSAESWSELVQLTCLGWLDRSTRASESESSAHHLSGLLSELILAASTQSASTH